MSGPSQLREPGLCAGWALSLAVVGCQRLLLGTGNVFCFLHLDFSAFFGWGVLLGSQANIKNKAASSRQSVRRAVAQYQTPKSLSY